MSDPETTQLILTLIQRVETTQDRMLNMQERHSEALRGMAEEMAEIRARLTVQQGCPGTCQRLELELKHIKDTHAATVADMDAELVKLKDQVSEFQSLLEQAKGGRKTLIMAGSIIAAMASVGTWMAGRISWK